jgi:hypothetical protein
MSDSTETHRSDAPALRTVGRTAKLARLYPCREVRGKSASCLGKNGSGRGHGRRQKFLNHSFGHVEFVLVVTKTQKSFDKLVPLSRSHTFGIRSPALGSEDAYPNFFDRRILGPQINELRDI